ncbi:pseudouridine synthase [Marinospirillum alkaliphilum]|uniref:Pseudouridine synthase n=1 Tax=Marinospirillum alkaliphilum DSM 21637 TaxID=1122209 RepID=A0A1K1V3C1_9GAMM|nr:pseudouridine synthase [Marinospirillum alkaliphilum]SFX19053.1 16S rRNA pseudouridine516 synthase [Marinospirillum alkaliphilum DSM 21637]
MRLDRFLSNRPHLSRKTARQLLQDGRVRLDGRLTCDPHAAVDAFSSIEIQQPDGDWQCLQQGVPRCYLMLNKPAGCVSATRDPQHPTVLDWIDAPWKDQLHLPGRLDFNTTGLLLLTNDGHWSRHLSLPDSELPKTYRVTTRDPISPETAAVFQQGVYFAYENLTTRPAELQLLASHQALLTIHEGRYHQVKRMFAAVGNKVVSLHRQSIGAVTLDASLQPGQWRMLTAAEITLLDCRPARHVADVPVEMQVSV